MTHKWLRILCTAVALLMLVSVFAGCKKTEEKAEDGDIVIGVLAPTTGSEAYYGQDMMRSYELAVSEINAAGGVLGRNLTLYQQDDACDPNVASQAAAKIIAQNVDFVVGGYCSGATIPALQQFYDAGLMMLISAANSTRITEQGHSQTFMLNSPGTHAVVTLMDLMGSLSVTKAALIHQGDDYTKNLADLCAEKLPQNGFEVVATEMMEKGTPDVSAIVTAIRNSGAEFVYWCGYHADGGSVIQQLRNGGFEGYIAVGDGSASVDLIAAAGAAGEGVYVTSPPFVEFAEGGEKFVADFVAMHGENPGTYATLCYDTIYVLAAAIETAGTTDTDAVVAAVAAIDYKGLSGRIKFTADRELAFSNFIILQIVNGKFELVTL